MTPVAVNATPIDPLACRATDAGPGHRAGVEPRETKPTTAPPLEPTER
jgi:hypothetical protein